MTAPGNSSTHPSTYVHGSFALTSLKRTFGNTSDRADMTGQPSASNLRPDDAFYGVDIRHEERGGTGEEDSLASDASEQMIIRRNTQIKVHTEET